MQPSQPYWTERYHATSQVTVNKALALDVLLHTEITLEFAIPVDVYRKLKPLSYRSSVYLPLKGIYLSPLNENAASCIYSVGCCCFQDLPIRIRIRIIYLNRNKFM